MDLSSPPPASKAKFAFHANNSSTSSLSGLEQSIRPQGTRYKPLPPPPSKDRRASLSSSLSRRDSIEDKPRRSSSVYSRAASLWHTGGQAGMIHDPMPPLNQIYMDANLASVATMSEPQLLLPRTYRPLLNSPSPSRPNSPSPRPPLEQRPSALLPPPIPHPKLPMEHLNTVPLSKARAAVAAPGAQHLLPEELRAQTLKRRKSSEHVTSLANQELDKPQRPGSTFKPHEIDVLRLPSMMMLDPKTWHNYNPALTAAATLNKAQERATEEPSEGERGRSMLRMPRKPLPKHDRKQKIDASQYAAEYSALLSDNDSAYSPNTNDNDDELYETSPSLTSPATTFHTGPAHSIPQPLFSFKPPAEPAGEIRPTTRNDTTLSASGTASPQWEIASIVTESTIDSDWTSDPPPAQFFDDTEESRDGSIPISSVDLDRPPLPPSPTLPSEHGNMMAPLLPASPNKDRKARESAYYPYVGSRKPRKTRKTSGAPSGHHLRTQIKQQAKNVPVLLQDVKKKAVRAVEELARPLAPLSIDKGPASVESPHLTPTTDDRLDQSVTAVYLGWSEESKSDYDASQPTSPKHHYARGRFNPKPDIKPTYTHITTPPRPLDERSLALAERPVRTRQASFLGSLLELQREKGREKKREEIKKTIRLIPNSSTDRASERPAVPVKTASDSVVPESNKEQAPRLGLWGRRISEFGLI